MTREEKINYWQGVINQYRDSGLSGAAFCRKHNINPGQFYHWRYRLKDSALKEDKGFFELIPCLSVEDTRPIHIHLTNGITIEISRGFDPTTLRSVIETVVSIRPCS